MIGDPPSMLLAGFAGMNFNDFFFLDGRPSMFFATQAGALVSFIVLWWVFRHDRGRVEPTGEDRVLSWTPTVMLCLLIVALAVASFTGIEEPDETAEMVVGPDLDPINGWICVVFAAVGLAWFRLRRGERLLPLARALDWSSGLFLIGCFVVVGAVSKAGWLDRQAFDSAPHREKGKSRSSPECSGRSDFSFDCVILLQGPSIINHTLRDKPANRSPRQISL